MAIMKEPAGYRRKTGPEANENRSGQMKTGLR